MKIVPMLFLALSVALVAGCSEQGPRAVTDGVDPQAIRDYEAAIAKVNQQDTESKMGASENTEEKKGTEKKAAAKK